MAGRWPDWLGLSQRLRGGGRASATTDKTARPNRRTELPTQDNPRRPTRTPMAISLPGCSSAEASR